MRISTTRGCLSGVATVVWCLAPCACQYVATYRATHDDLGRIDASTDKDAAPADAPWSIQSDGRTGEAGVSQALSVEVSRVAGVAPLAVFFEARVANAAGFDNPKVELFYQWSYGDPDSGQWLQTERSKDLGTGALGFHVFERPGNYTVQLTVTGTGVSRAWAAVISVADPDEVFAGEQTVCFSLGNDFVDCPQTARRVANATSADVQNELVGPRRLLFEGGASFSLNTLTLAGPGPVLISTYGSDAAAELVLDQLKLGTADKALEDWRLAQLKIVAPNPGLVPLVEAGGSLTDVLILRTSLGAPPGMTLFEASTSLLDSNITQLQLEQTMYRGLALVGSSFIGGDLGAWLGAERLAVVDNTFDSAGTGLFVEYAAPGIVAHNRIKSGSLAQVALFVSAPDAQNSKILPGQATRDLWISDNRIDGNEEPRAIAIAPHAVAEMRIDNVVFERNYLALSSYNHSALHINARDVVLRNNLIAGESSEEEMSFVALAPGGWVSQADSVCTIVNNSLLRFNAGTARVLTQSASLGQPPRVVIANNVLYADESTAVFAGGAVTNPELSANLIRPRGHFSSLPAGPIYAAWSDSALVDQGVPLTTVHVDFMAAPRPASTMSPPVFDIGALELQPE